MSDNNNASIRAIMDSLYHQQCELRLKRLDLWNQKSITPEQYWKMKEVEDNLADSANKLAINIILVDLGKLQESSRKIQATTSKLNAKIAELQATDHFLSSLSKLIDISAQIVLAGACGNVPGIALLLDKFLKVITQ